MKTKLLIVLILSTILPSCFAQTNNEQQSKGSIVTTLSKSILLIYQSSNGVYWFGSDADGVYRFDGNTIIHYSEQDGLTNNRIRSIQEDKNGNIYFATLGGICKFDGKTFITLTAIRSNHTIDDWKLHPDDLWFTLTGKKEEFGPYRYDGKTLYQLQFPKHHLEDDYHAKNPNKPWSPYEVYSIYKDSKQNIWFGTSNFGLCCYDGQSIRWMYEDQLTNVPNGGSFGIRSILEDANGYYWICNTNYKFDFLANNPKEKTLLQYKKHIGIEGIKSSNGNDGVYFMSAVKDKFNNLWLATYDQGIWCYNEKTVQQYLVKEGTKTVTLYSVYIDKTGSIWLGTHESGAYKFNGTSFEKFKS